MKPKLSPFLVGSFVLGGLVLLVVALLALRSFHPFAPPGRFLAYFKESVQGLDVGSAVKLRGVRVGRIVAIRVQYAGAGRPAEVEITAELDRHVLEDRAGQPIALSDPKTLQRLVDEGLRAKIDLVGITGLQFLQLDFFDPKVFPAPPVPHDSPHPVVPAVRSSLSTLIGNVSRIANQLESVDFAALSHELQSLLATSRRQLDGLDLPGLVTRLTAAAASVEAFAGSPDARVAFTHLNRTTQELQALTAHLDRQVQPAADEWRRTLLSFKAATESVRKAVDSPGGLGEEAGTALRQVTDAAGALQRLTEYLERNPSALVTGRRRSGPDPGPR
jgi:paraquat-inducible protein B